MARALLRVAAVFLAGAGLLYGIVFAKLETFTLYEHGARIAATPEAQQLGAEVSGAAADLAGLLRDGLTAAPDSSSAP